LYLRYNPTPSTGSSSSRGEVVDGGSKATSILHRLMTI
jgi:hypothetical protein